MKLVAKYDVYLDMLLMVSIYVIHYLSWSGHRIQNCMFGPGSILDLGPLGPLTQDLGTRGPGTRDPKRLCRGLCIATRKGQSHSIHYVYIYNDMCIYIYIYCKFPIGSLLAPYWLHSETCHTLWTWAETGVEYGSAQVRVSQAYTMKAKSREWRNLEPKGAYINI